jgi:hypothetical protein
MGALEDKSEAYHVNPQHQKAKFPYMNVSSRTKKEMVTVY